MKYQYLCLNISCIIRIGCCKGTMKAYYACNICTATCKLKHYCSSKTVSHGSKMTFISKFMILKYLQTCLSACPHETAVIKIHTGNFGCLFVILWSHAFSIDVCCKSNISKFCKLLSASFYIGSKTGPFMDDHHSRSFSLDCIIICQIAFHDCITFFILNGFCMKFGLNICCQKEDKNYGK